MWQRQKARTIKRGTSLFLWVFITTNPIEFWVFLYKGILNEWKLLESITIENVYKANERQEH